MFFYKGSTRLLKEWTSVIICQQDSYHKMNFLAGICLHVCHRNNNPVKFSLTYASPVEIVSLFCEEVKWISEVFSFILIPACFVLYTCVLASSLTSRSVQSRSSILHRPLHARRQLDETSPALSIVDLCILPDAQTICIEWVSWEWYTNHINCTTSELPFFTPERHYAHVSPVCCLNFLRTA